MQWLGNVDLNKRTLGNSIGKYIGGALNSLAEHKTKNLVNKEKSKLWHSLGVDKDTAQSLMRQPESIQKAFFDRWDSQPQQNAQQAQQQPQQDIQPSFTAEQTNLLKSIANPMDRQKAAQGFIQQNKAQIPQQSANEQIGQVAGQQVLSQDVNQSDKPGLRSPGKLTQQQELAQYRDLLKERAEIRKVEQADVKESKKWYHDKTKKVHGIKENNLRLDRMKKLVENGKLTSPEVAAALDSLAHGIWGVGINLKGWQNQDSHEFEKLSSDMFKGIQDIFGSRILKTEVDNFAKTIPTLLQSDAGKIAVIDNLKMISEATLKEDQVAKSIIKANGGKVPANLEDLVEEQLGDYLDDLHDRFVNQIHAIPENQDKTNFKHAFVKKAFKQGLTGSF